MEVRNHGREPYSNEPLHQTLLRKEPFPTLLVKALLSKSTQSILEAVTRRSPFELEYVQAAQELVQSLEPVFSRYPQYAQVLERLLEPERVLAFRVLWMDDKGEVHVNRGFQIQYNEALGHLEGGLRFHPTVNLSVMKFLGLEQTLKNSLVSDCLGGFCLGGARGGSDFDPRGKSDCEVMRFCQSFMKELFRHLGPKQNCIDGDIGVDQRELGFLFGQYRRLTKEFEGFSLGMAHSWAASNLRTQATGYGLVYFTEQVLAGLGKELKGHRCVMSGSGKLALYTLEKLIAVGVHVVTISDSNGYLLDNDGFDFTKLKVLRDIRSLKRSLREYVQTYPRSSYREGQKPWTEKCDLAIPCAIQHEIRFSEAQALVNAGCQVLIEGASMSCTSDAMDVLKKSSVVIGPGKAAGVGGAVVAALEWEHKKKRTLLEAEELDMRLQVVMRIVYQNSVKAALDYGFAKNAPELLVFGANIASFCHVALCMLDQGRV